MQLRDRLEDDPAGSRIHARELIARYRVAQVLHQEEVAPLPPSRRPERDPYHARQEPPGEAVRQRDRPFLAVGRRRAVEVAEVQARDRDRDPVAQRLVEAALPLVHADQFPERAILKQRHLRHDARRSLAALVRQPQPGDGPHEPLALAQDLALHRRHCSRRRQVPAFPQGAREPLRRQVIEPFGDEAVHACQPTPSALRSTGRGRWPIRARRAVRTRPPSAPAPAPRPCPSCPWP